jgi:hypothetical protein
MEKKPASKAQQAPNKEDQAENASIHEQPTVQQETQQGEAQIDKSQTKGHAYTNTLPQKQPGQKTTTGVDKK